MTKTLVLFRHGRSQVKDFIDDKDRPLTEKGVEEVEQTGIRLFEKINDFDCVYCSTAVRTRETLNALQAIFTRPDLKVEFREHLYMPNKESLLHFLRAIPSHQNRVLIVGHNPSLHEVIHEIGEREIDSLETGSCIQLEYEMEHWSELHFKYCIRQQLDSPEIVV